MNASPGARDADDGLDLATEALLTRRRNWGRPARTRWSTLRRCPRLSERRTLPPSSVLVRVSARKVEYWLSVQRWSKVILGQLGSLIDRFAPSKHYRISVAFGHSCDERKASAVKTSAVDHLSDLSSAWHIAARDTQPPRAGVAIVRTATPGVVSPSQRSPREKSASSV